MAICDVEAMHVRDPAQDAASAAPAATSPRDYADITGIRIDRLRRLEVLARIDQFIQSGLPHQIVTVNADFLSIARRDPGFIDQLNAAAISVPDGMPLVWLSRALGVPLAERITGTDLLLDCAALAAQKRYRIFLLGAGPGVATQLATILTARYPGLEVVGAYTPPYYEDRDAVIEAQMVELVRQARPDMLFVAMGTPKQEKWIADHLIALAVPVCIGVGGVFNFLTGRIPRAPQWVQQLGLEWCFRLLLEPRRLWKRYLVDDTQALAHAFLYSHRQRTARATAAHNPAGAPAPAPTSPAPGLAGRTGTPPPLGDNVEWPFHPVDGPAPTPAESH